MSRFGESKATHGYTISLYGCAYCNFNYVLAVAADADGNESAVAQWSMNAASGLYVLKKEHERNPSGWLALATSALPKHQQPAQQEQKEEGESI